MGTRGLYGFRKNETDKISYNHCDSYPEGLGVDIMRFVRNHSNEEMNELYDRIIMVDERDKPTFEEKQNCRKNASVDLNVSSGSEDDWYCLLRGMQGDLEKLYQCEFPYMIDNKDFIKDSLFCEYAYIINLDTNMLEYYEGFQKEPQDGNRYGEEANGNGYYPCRWVATIPLGTIRIAESVNDVVNEFMAEE